MVRRKSGYPRIVRPETVQEGDSIRFQYQHLDALITVSGTVHVIRADNQDRMFYTHDGVLLMRYNIRSPKRGIVELLFRPDDEQIPLELFRETLKERIQ